MILKSIDFGVAGEINDVQYSLDHFLISMPTNYIYTEIKVFLYEKVTDKNVDYHQTEGILYKCIQLYMQIQL